MNDPRHPRTDHQMKNVTVPVQVFYGTTEVHRFQFPTDGIEISAVTKAAAEEAFRVLNIDHPPGFQHRSMSVGDIVVVGEIGLRCEPVGWAELDASELATLIADTSRPRLRARTSEADATRPSAGRAGPEL